jgi:Alginate lyase
MRSFRCWVALLALGPAIALQVAAGPATLDPGEVRSLRELVARDQAAGKQYQVLRQAADAALDDTPQPIDRIVGEGRLESDPQKIQSKAALRDFDKVDALAWAWAVSGDERYARKGREFIDAWARVNQSDGNPINESRLEPLIEAYDLLRETYDAAGRARIDRWLNDRAMILWKDARGHKENWQSHRLKIVGLIGAATGSEQVWRLADQGFKDQIGSNFADGGESVDFKRRDALHYHLYAVQPLLKVACVAQHKGERLLDYTAGNGASLREAVDFIEPYATGQKKHVEFADSQVGFDRKRANAGEKEYSQRNWNPKASVPLYAEAGCVDPSYDKLAARIAGSAPSPYVNWRSVLNAATANRPR